MLNKKDTTSIKGIAVVFMVILHTFNSPSWWNAEILIKGSQFPYYFGHSYVLSTVSKASDLCIALFAFVTGYGISAKIKDNRYNYKKQICGLYKLLIPFWITIIIFYVLNFKSLSVHKFINNMCLISFHIVPFAWYVRFYIIIIIIFPILYKLVHAWYQKIPTGFPLMIGCSIICFLITRQIGYDNSNWFMKVAYEYFLYLPFIMIGICCDLFEWLKRFDNIVKLKKGSLFTGIIGIVFIIFARAYITKGNLRADPYLALGFIICFYLLSKQNTLSKVKDCFGLLGRYSTGIWFFHGIFFFPSVKYQIFAYWPRIPVLIILWILMLGIPYGMLMNKILDFFIVIKNKCKFSKTIDKKRPYFD